MKIVACVDGLVGRRLVGWLSEHYPDAITLFVTTSENHIYVDCKEASLPVAALNGEGLHDLLARKVGKFDLGLLLWWPTIIRPDAIALSRQGFINTHPSLLPLHRGKNPNFWAIKEGEPFGVSLHFLGSGVDDGDIVAQREVPYDWQDDGGTLYRRGLDAMIDLFKEVFPSVISGDVPRRKQVLEAGSFHYGKELDPASLIDLDATYKARDLINLLRARTFDQYPSCRFEDDGSVYEIRIRISKKD